MGSAGEIVVDRVPGLPPDELAPLVAESEREGRRFVRRLADELADGSNRFDRPGEGLFAARAGGRLVGVCALGVDPYAGDPAVGRLRRLYVLHDHRGHGTGTRLVRAVVAAAAGPFRILRLRAETAEAGRLYERLGFRPAAGATDCTHLLDLPAGPGARPATAWRPGSGWRRPS